MSPRPVVLHEVRCRGCRHRWWSRWADAPSLPLECVLMAKPRGPARQRRVRALGSGSVVDVADVMDAMPERRFDAWFRSLATRLGYRAYHTRRSTGSQFGYPDWHLVRPPRSIFVELKVGRNAPTLHQQRWLADLAACGHEVYVFFPRQRDEIEEVLSR